MSNFLFLLLLLVVHSSAIGNVQQALQDLYISTSGPQNWILKNGWLQGDPCINGWYGVRCENGTVTAINLPSNNLTGELPLPMYYLQALKNLTLADNKINGSVPSSFGLLGNLIRLELQGNFLTGIIPSSLNQLANLQFLDLSSNLLSDTIPQFWTWGSKLTFVNISHNSLYGGFPQQSVTETRRSMISVFDASYNSISDAFPSTLFFTLNQLAFFRLDHNFITGDLVLEVLVFLLGSIKTFSMSFNQLSGSLPDSFGMFSVLEYLDLSNNKFGGPVPTWIFSSSIRKASLGNNRLTGTVTFPNRLLSNLVVLELQANLLSGLQYSTSYFRDQVKLTTMYFNGNNFTIPVPDVLSNASVFLAGNYWRCPLPDFSWLDKSSTQCLASFQSSYVLPVGSNIQLQCGFGDFTPVLTLVPSVGMTALAMTINVVSMQNAPALPVIKYSVRSGTSSDRTTGLCIPSSTCILPTLPGNQTSYIEPTVYFNFPGQLKYVAIFNSVDSIVVGTATVEINSITLHSQTTLTALMPPYGFSPGGSAITIIGSCFLSKVTPTCEFISLSSNAIYITFGTVLNSSALVCNQPAIYSDTRALLKVSFDNMTWSNSLSYVIYNSPYRLATTTTDGTILLKATRSKTTTIGVNLIDNNKQVIPVTLLGNLFPLSCTLLVNTSSSVYVSSNLGTSSLYEVSVYVTGPLLAGQLLTVDCGANVLSGTQNITLNYNVTFGAPYQLVIKQQPSLRTDNRNLLDPQPILALTDESGNSVSSSTDIPVDLTVQATIFSVESPLGTLGRVSNFPNNVESNGIVFYNNVKFIGIHGKSYVMVFSANSPSTGLTMANATSTLIQVDACGAYGGTYYDISGTSYCLPCPPGAYCDPSIPGSITSAPGYWTFSAKSLIFLPCRPFNPDVLDNGRRETYCLGGNTCKKGYSGPLCASCEGGWGMTFYRWCTKCRDKASAQFLIVWIFMIYMAAVCWLCLASLRLEEPSSFITVTRMLINHLHLTSRIPLLLSGTYPQVLERLFSITLFTSEFTLNVSYLHCGLEWTKMGAFIAYMVSPWVISIPAIGCLVTYMILPNPGPLERPPDDISVMREQQSPEARANSTHRSRFQRAYGMVPAILACLSALGLLLFPMLVQQSGEWFRCEGIPTDVPTYLASDPYIDCTSPQFAPYQKAAIAMFCIYSLTILIVPPLMIAYMTPIMGEKATGLLFSYVMGGYRRETWWWETLVTLRKYLLILIIIFGLTPLIRTYLALLLYSVSFILLTTIWPYAEAKYNKMELLSVVTTIITLLWGLFLHEGASVVQWIRLAISTLLMIFQCFTITYFLYFMFRNTTQKLYRTWVLRASAAAAVPASSSGGANVTMSGGLGVSPNVEIGLVVSSAEIHNSQLYPKTYIPFQWKLKPDSPSLFVPTIKAGTGAGVTAITGPHVGNGAGVRVESEVHSGRKAVSAGVPSGDKM